MKLINPEGTKKIIVEANQNLEITLQDLEAGSRTFELEVYLEGENSQCSITGRATSTQKDQKVWKIKQIYQGQNQTGNIELKGTAEDNALLQFDGGALLEQSSAQANAHIDERIILFDDAKGKCLPVLRVETDDVASAGHGASIAPIEPEKILFLSSRGIDTNTAKQMLKDGFLT